MLQAGALFCWLRRSLFLRTMLLWTLLVVSALAQNHSDVVVIRQAKASAETTRGVFLLANTQLPFRWDAQFPDENGRIQYELTLPATSSIVAAPQLPQSLLALYIPRVGNQAQIWLNDQLVYSSATLDNALRDSSQHPALVSLPRQLLHAQAPNQLRIQTAVQSLRWGGLSEVYFGTNEALCNLYDHAQLWQQTSYVVILVALFFMGLFSFFIWWRQRERHYLYFVWSAIAGCIVAIDHLITEHYLPWPLQGIVAAVALAWHVIFMSRFALEVVGRFEHWVSLAMLATTLSIGIAYVLAEPIYWTMTYALLCLPLFAALICTASAADSEQSGQARLLFFVSLVSALAAMRDLFVVHWPVAGISEFVLMPHALFLFVAVMGWILVQRYTEQHRLFQDLNTTLEQRVSEREQQLASSFKQLQTQGEERAKLLERQRIMQDIHDGVGGQLVSLVNMIKRSNKNQPTTESKQLQEHAQMALDELRVAIDSMQSVEGDLATVLATLRYRLEPRLQAAGLALVWAVGELPAMQDLTPQKVLQIQKIVLEALTNVMQHAHAKQVTIAAKWDAAQQAICIQVIDDGIGFASEVQANDLPLLPGHGLRNMRFRAEAIGARISFSRGLPEGTVVQLQIPV